MKKLFLALCVSLVLTACGTVAPKVDSVADGLIVTAVNIETLADQVADLCGNVEPGGDCLPGALIDNEDRDKAKAALTRAQDALEAGLAIYTAGGDATSTLARAEAILLTVEAMLGDP